MVRHPAALHGAKSLRARVRRVEQPATERDVTWPAHVRVDIRRDPANDEPAPLPLAVGRRAAVDPRHQTWGHERWPHVKPLLRRAFDMRRRQIARDG